MNLAYFFFSSIEVWFGKWKLCVLECAVAWLLENLCVYTLVCVEVWTCAYLSMPQQACGGLSTALGAGPCLPPYLRKDLLFTAAYMGLGSPWASCLPAHHPCEHYIMVHTTIAAFVCSGFVFLDSVSHTSEPSLQPKPDILTCICREMISMPPLPILPFVSSEGKTAWIYYFLKGFIFICIYVCVYVCLYLHVHVGVWGGQKRMLDAPGASITGSCEQPSMCVRNQIQVFCNRSTCF